MEHNARALPAKAQDGSIPIEALVGKLNSPRSTKEIGEVQGECALLDILFQHTRTSHSLNSMVTPRRRPRPGLACCYLLPSCWLLLAKTRSRSAQRGYQSEHVESP